MSVAEFLCPDEAATCALAADLAKRCRAGDCLLLEGDLGAGKTAFARGFIKTLVPGAQEIVSPTFTIVQTYETPAGILLNHFDLYRLEDESELQEIGLDEALQSGITLIEWPALASAWLPKDALHIAIHPHPHSDARRFTLTGWDDRLKDMT